MSVPVKQCTFAGGEISPQAFARSDLGLYEKSARTLRNMVCMKHGGVVGRPGTMYVGQTFNGGNPVRLIPFIFNETGLGQSYVLEFGNGYIAFYQNGNNIFSEVKNISGATQANPAVITASGGAAYSNGDIVRIDSVLGMTQLNRNYYVVTALSSDTFSLTDLFGNVIDSTSFSAYVSGGSMSKVYKIASPYAQADLALLNFEGSADVLTIVHQNYQVRELRRSGTTNWSLVGISNWGSNVTAPSVSVSGTAGSTLPIILYQVTSVDSKGQESDAGSPGFLGGLVSSTGFNTPSVTAPITLTWSAIPGAVYYRVYSGPQPNGALGYIGQVTGTQFLDSGFTPDFTNIYPQYTQLFGSDGGTNNPGVIGFSQQRRYFGETIDNPIGFWGSQPGLYSNFDVHLTSIDSDAVIGTLAGQEVNAIKAITELKFMLMLTSGAEIYVQGNGSGVVTPSSINASVQSQYGCAPLRPLKCADVLLFNQSLGSFIRDFAFDFAIDGYRGNDITIFAAHLFEGYQIVDWCYQKIPDSIIWAVRSDGMLLSCTYIREQQVLAWTHHDLQNGFVENVSAIPENGQYAVYASIRRVINGNTVRYVERLSSRIWQGPTAEVAIGTANTIGDPIEAPFCDCSSQYDGRNSGTTTMTLSGGDITITAGVNDQISFTVSSVTYTATIPGGIYTIDSILTAIATAMNTAHNNSYTALTIVNFGVTVIEIRNDGTAVVCHFAAPQTAGQTLGFDAANLFSGAGGLVGAAQNPPITGPFSSSSTAYQQLLTVTSSVSLFTSSMIGDQIFIQDALFVSSQGKKGNQIRLTIQSIILEAGNSGLYYGAIVTPSGSVPSDLQNIATENWSLAVQTISGLTYLSGQKVSVWADRFVVGSPLNSSYSVVYTVPASGILTLDKPYAVIYVGLPMIQDIETLDLETYFGETILGRRKRVAGLYGYVYNTRSFYAGSENPDSNNQNTTGDLLFQLSSLRMGVNQSTYDQPPTLTTGQQYLITAARWEKKGSLFMRNVDPLPWSILAVSPKEEDAVQTPYKRV